MRGKVCGKVCSAFTSQHSTAGEKSLPSQWRDNCSAVGLPASRAALEKSRAVQEFGILVFDLISTPPLENFLFVCFVETGFSSGACLQVLMVILQVQST